MKNAILILSLIFIAAGTISAQTADNSSPVQKFEANPDKGFAYPFYLFIPPELREEKAQKQTHTILVIPNNTGKINDDLAVHEENVKSKMIQIAFIMSKLKTPVLMPVFPRPATDWKIYTHALDRDSMLTDKKEYKRFDLQLAAMIDHARTELEAEKIKTEKRVLLNGFSASGMFVNRFVFLHPERVKAAAIGSPGGWAIAPVAVFKEKPLPYPVGTSDFKAVSGKNFDLKSVQKVPMFIFLGDKDENDSVVYRDGYEETDEKLIFELFGKTPVARWEISKQLYEEQKLKAEFKLYPNTEHKVSNEIVGDILAFLEKHKN